MMACLMAAILPASEMRVVDTVADHYDLNREERHLMCAIRRAENGIPPYYFGVANRKANTYEKQARYTANTIRLRYNGDLEAFAKRWCPNNWRVWLKNVKWFTNKQEKEVAK